MLVVFATVCVGVLGFVLAAGAVKPPKGGGGEEPRTFEVSGVVEGLWPGATLPIAVKIENPYQFAIVVTSVEVQVGAPASGTCPASTVSVEPLATEVTVRARRDATVELAATLAAATPDACHGATWPLSYTATARRG